VRDFLRVIRNVKFNPIFHAYGSGNGGANLRSLCSWQKPEAQKRQCDEKWWSCFELNQSIHGLSFPFPR